MTANRSLGRRISILAGAAAIVAAVVVGIVLVDPLPPRRVRMATGPPGGAYVLVAKRYQEILARNGVQLELIPTNGSVDNLARLLDPRSGVSVALVQGGLTNAKESPGLASLGTVFYEPIWYFARGPMPELRNLIPAGSRICIGMPGSGTRKLVGELLGAMRADLSKADVRDLDPEQAADALQKGELDMAAFVLSWEAPLVRRLLADPSLRVVSFERADAHLALRPYLEKLRLPRGVADLALDLPPADVTLIGPKASLVVRDDLSEGIQFLLLEAAVEVHGAPGIFNRAAVFPAAEAIDLPLSEYARQYYRSGRPFLQRYLPFWLAVFVGRLLILLIPFAGVLYPLFRLLPAGYFWWMRHRIYRLYGELKQLDFELGLSGAGRPDALLVERLESLEQRANRLRVPASLALLLFTLRDHIAVVRRRVGKG